MNTESHLSILHISTINLMLMINFSKKNNVKIKKNVKKMPRTSNNMHTG